jgi:ABC-type dipeptide/oligopeptide/nickel transport system permease component
MLTRGTLIYIGQRIVLIAFTVLAVSSIVFLGIHRLPGDALFNEHLHGTQYELLLHHYGLDRPLWDQYTSFLSGLFLHGNLGESLVNRGVPITPLVLRELTVSVEVGLFALIFTIGLGMLLGVVAAIRQNTWIDYLLSTTNLGQAPWPEDDQDDHEQDGDVAPVDAERRRWLDW